MSHTDASHEAGSGMPATRLPKENLYRADFGSDLHVRDAGDGETGPVLAGHFSKFNQWTEINSKYEGRFMERVAPGAFSKTIKESASKMRVLFNHGRDVLGQQILGPIRSLREDEQGAAYEVELFDGIPPLILSGLRAGQYGSSFQFEIQAEDFVSHPKRSEYNPQGLPERTIREARVREFGPVTFGAYAGATSGIRSITDDIIFNNLLSDSDRLRALIAEELDRRRFSVSLSGASGTFTTSSNETTASASVRAAADEEFLPVIEPEPSEATTPDEHDTIEPDPSADTTRAEDNDVPGIEPEPPGATTRSERDLFWFAPTPKTQRSK